MTVPGISVLTPTIPGRERLLMDAVQSVQAQTEEPTRHLVMLDADAAGPAIIRNLLIRQARTDWVAFLDDDDVLHDDHIEALCGALDDTGADLAFSWHTTTGAVPLVPRFDEWNSEAVAYMHAGINVVPVTVLARRSAILDAGGFNPADRYEDYSLWLRMLDNGSTFVCVPRETWTYRMLGGNRTWQ